MSTVFRSVIPTLVTLVLFAAPLRAQGDTSETKTRVFHGGTILTVDESFSEAEAIAIRGNKIVAVGDKKSVVEMAGKDAELVDLEDKVMLPAFIDAHTHPVAGGIATIFESVGQEKFSTVEECIEYMTKVEANAKAQDWLLFRDVDLATQSFSEDALTAKDLDQVSESIPVFVWHAGGHVATVNTKMLDLLGVKSLKPNDDGYGRYEDGSPNGVLFGSTIASALQKVTPFREYNHKNGTIKLAKKWLTQGLGTLGVAGAGNATASTKDWAILRELSADQRFPFRTRVYLQASMLDKWDAAAIKPGVGGASARVIGYKISVDGSNQARTGLQRQPYLGGDDRGREYMTEEQVMQTVLELSKRGSQLAMHGNGDAAIDRIIRAVAAARSDGLKVNRPRIEHCSIVQDDQLKQLVENEISGSFLIAHVFFWGKAFRDDVFGLEKANKLDRCGSFERSKIPYSLHSDFSVSELAPLEMIEVAVTRTLFAEPQYVLAEEECASIESAIRAVTSVPAWQLQSEHEIGSLEEGKLADFAILEADPRDVAADRIGEIKVLETWIDGVRVYQAE